MAKSAGSESQKAIMALSEIPQQPKNVRKMRREEAQDKMMIQTDINIQSYLVQSQIYEKLSKF